MLKDTHIAAGTCAGLALAVAYSTPPLAAAAIVGGAMVGSLLPDIDHGNSFVSKRMKPVGWVARLFFGHRTFFHSFIVYTIVFAALWLNNQPLATALFPLFAGIASHIFLDALNPAGVPLLFKQRIHLAKIHTGSKTENMLRFILGILGICLSGCYALMLPQIL